MIIKTGSARRRYNDPLQDDVAAIFTSIDCAGDIPHDIIVYTHSNQLRLISYLSPNSDPMCYPILYPSDESGWSIGIPMMRSTQLDNELQYLFFNIILISGVSEVLSILFIMPVI